MEDRQIPDGQITASSTYSDRWAAKNGRLNNAFSAWAAMVNNQRQHLAILLFRSTNITGVATQGGKGDKAEDWWVSAYLLGYSYDGKHVQFYKEKGQTTAKVKSSRHSC